MYNSSNYGYNPYGRYTPPEPMQPIQTNNNYLTQNNYKLQGKQVDSIEVVKGMDIPLDGSISYFPIADGNTIVSKQLQMDGTSKIQVFKLVENSDIKTPKYITQEELSKEIKKIDLSDIDDLKEELKDIKKEIKDLKKKSD